MRNLPIWLFTLKIFFNFKRVLVTSLRRGSTNNCIWRSRLMHFWHKLWDIFLIFKLHSGLHLHQHCGLPLNRQYWSSVYLGPDGCRLDTTKHGHVFLSWLGYYHIQVVTSLFRPHVFKFMKIINAENWPCVKIFRRSKNYAYCSHTFILLMSVSISPLTAQWHFF